MAVAITMKNRLWWCFSLIRGSGGLSMTLSSLRETTPRAAQSLTDGVRLSNGAILPWLGFGTYKLKSEQVQECVAQAIDAGYCAIDTAFIYGGEKTERLIGEMKLDRSKIFLTSKHWRKYHGYEPTLECLRLSLQRLQTDYIDLWLMHWPGPAWNTMARRKDLVEHDQWHYATISAEDLPRARAETWRAMEDAYRQGKVRAIGVSNMTVEHLKALKQTATIWPPTVNQVELHPLRPQTELLEYCRQEGIVVQAYASLGGQDVGRKTWNQLLGPTTKKGDPPSGLQTCEPVLQLAREVNATPAQVLLRWALDQGCVLIPKTTRKDRLVENVGIFSFSLTPAQIEKLTNNVSELARQHNPELSEVDTRLCWRNDPLRMLDFA